MSGAEIRAAHGTSQIAEPRYNDDTGSIARGGVGGPSVPRFRTPLGNVVVEKQ
jgi:hypothetical protein